MDPLGGGARGPGTTTINAKNVDGRPLGRRCRRSGSAHHQRKKRRRQAPWEVMPEVQERPPSMQKILTAGPVGGGAEGLRAPTINIKNVDGEPPGRRCRRSGSVHHQHKKHQRHAPRRRCRRSESTHNQRKKTSMVAPLGGSVEGPRASTINVKNVDGGAPGAHGVSGLYPRSERCVVTCIGIIDRSNSAHGSHSPCA
jgi:hypothetical protein